MQDKQARQEALTPNLSYIVQAPAGSGKTELLTQRYLTLLGQAVASPEEIIAITFTRKAATEMRARIISAIEMGAQLQQAPDDHRTLTWKLAKQVAEKNNVLQWALLQNPNRLRILTIDALAAFLARRLPLLSNFIGTAVIAEYPNTLYQQAAERVINAPPIDANRMSNLLLHLDNRADILQDLMIDLLSHRDQWLPIIMRAQEIHSLRTLLEKNLTKVVLEKLQSAASLTPEALQKNTWLENYCDWTWQATPDITTYENWKKLAGLLLTEKNEWRQTVDKRQGFSPEDKHKPVMKKILLSITSEEAFKKALIDIRHCPPLQYSDAQWNILSILTDLLPYLAAQLQLIFKEKKQIDFIELNLTAQHALGSQQLPTDFALSLDYQIKHLLIGEFQDTSLTHFHLIENLISGWQPRDGKTLFIVGDPMQSIYRFRNAEVGLFLRTQMHGIASISLTPLQLTTNFRSEASLIQWINKTFLSLFPQSMDIPTGRVPYVLATTPEENTFEQSENISKKINCYADNYQEACAITKAIDHLRQSNADDTIAILVRTRNQLADIIPSLQKNNIPYLAVDIDSLYFRPEIQDALALTRALWHRADRIAWLALLRSPFCGLRLTDLEVVSRHDENNTIWQSIQAHGEITSLSGEAKERVAFLHCVLSQAFQQQSHYPFAQWVEKVWENIGGYLVYKNPSEINNIRLYFDLLIDTEKNEYPLSFAIFMERCQLLFAKSIPNANNPVQIMTIHKSKGLEFDHVFLPGLQNKITNDPKKLLRYSDQLSAATGDDFLLAPIMSASDAEEGIYDYLKNIEREKQSHEFSRLLYVACTRAKKDLYLSAVESEKMEGSFLKLLSPYVACEKVADSEVRDEKRNSIALTRLKKMLPHPIHDTVLNPDANITLTLPDAFSNSVGIVIHELLYELSFQAIPYEKKRWLARLQHEGILSKDCLENAITLVELAYAKINQDARGQWILAPHKNAQAEWALSALIDASVVHKIG